MTPSKKIEFSAVDLNALTSEVIKVHLPLADHAGLALIFDPEKNLNPVRAEPNQLARVITNLMANAIRYTPNGSVCLHTFRDNGRVCLQVQDTGMGIDREDIPHLFERFYRGQKVRQSPIPGTGLGLAISKEIIDLHDGELEVESEPGKGSTFSVWLPVAEES